METWGGGVDFSFSVHWTTFRPTPLRYLEPSNLISVQLSGRHANAREPAWLELVGERLCVAVVVVVVVLAEAGDLHP